MFISVENSCVVYLFILILLLSLYNLFILFFYFDK